MPSSERRLVSRLAQLALGSLTAAALLLGGGRARAQEKGLTPTQGFAVERFYASAPGGGWMVMDSLDMRGGLGGALAISGGYAKNPLVLGDGIYRTAVVSDQAFVDVGFAVTYDFLRFYLNLTSPLAASGDSGTVSYSPQTGPIYQLQAPSGGLGPTPDTISDVRLGIDARLLGGPKSRFRLGLGAQLFVNSGERSDYVTDGTYRAMGRLLFAGDVGHITYAGQLGVHVRPLDDAPSPGSPRGSELLYGIALGPRLPLSDKGTSAIVVGPELFGATPLRSLFGTSVNALEAMLSARVEGTEDDGLQLRAKIGLGAGITSDFGAPEWRMVVGLEVFDHGGDRDGDGITDSKDACPDTWGSKTKNPATNGCPADPEGGSGR